MGERQTIDMSGSHHHKPVSRRSFLQGAVAATKLPAAASASTEAQEPERFGSAAQPRTISANLFVLEDTYNVYLIRDGAHSLLIDFGSGAILPHLGALGIEPVEWILHTHFH